MPNSTFLIQGISDERHESHLLDLLRLTDVSHVLAGVAYVKESGVSRIAEVLGRVGDKAAFFVGIRNEITSYQGVRALLETGAKVWAVDTATRRRVYHPKLYLARSAREAVVLIGSANLTAGGLGLNVEASARLSFDLANKADAKTVKGVSGVFESLPRQHPNHVFRIKNEAAAAKLLEQGRLEDEQIKVSAPAAGRIIQDRWDDLLPMSLKNKLSKSKATARKGNQKTGVQESQGSTFGYRLVWTSNPLTERDLNIPTGPQTHATGSMGLKRGSWDTEMDHRHYFRENVFAACLWEIDPGNSRWERASIVAELKVKGIWHGLFAFRLSHNRDVHSRTYEQKNFMTHFSWGDAKPLIARQDLLGRQMSLFREDADPGRPRYLIDID